MSDGNVETVCPERLNRFILHTVRTGYGIAPLPQDSGKTGHAGPADADHVNVGSRKRMNIDKGSPSQCAPFISVYLARDVHVPVLCPSPAWDLTVTLHASAVLFGGKAGFVPKNKNDNRIGNPPDELVSVQKGLPDCSQDFLIEKAPGDGAEKQLLNP